MEFTTLAVLLSEEKRAKGRRGRRRDRRHSDDEKSSKKRGQDMDSESIKRALGRFNVEPPPMGFPREIDPPPRKIDVKWKLNAVSRDVQNKTGEIVSRRGEFGFLPQERVDEIASELAVSYTHLTLPTILRV